jgi:hypothetical protein
MLYLIDSTAKNSLGHNLEYLKRVSSSSKSDYLILGNKELNPNEDLRYRPTFEFGTWDFGRFGFDNRKSKVQRGQTSQTLRASKVLLVTEKLLENFAKFAAGFNGQIILFLTGLTKQSKCFYRDISLGLADMGHDSKVIISTANSRELVGLRRWIRDSDPPMYTISVILRRPIVDLRSFFELPFTFIETLITISIIRALAIQARFLSDTPGLAARISDRCGVIIKEIPALGFEPVQVNTNRQLDIAIAPNSRLETRYAVEALSNIPDLSSTVKANLDSNSYRELLSTTRSILLPYDPLRYRSRSSGIFAEALTLGILPIVPTGTSMSREITKLNSTILSPPMFTVELKVGKKIALKHLEGECLILTLEANFSGSLVLEISDTISGARKTLFDFFESSSKDCFIYQPRRDRFLSFKSDTIFLRGDSMLKLSVNKVPTALFGTCFLEDDLENVLSLTKEISFQNQSLSLIGAHSPASICESLGI